MMNEGGKSSKYIKKEKMRGSNNGSRPVLVRTKRSTTSRNQYKKRLKEKEREIKRVLSEHKSDIFHLLNIEADSEVMRDPFSSTPSALAEAAFNDLCQIINVMSEFKSEVVRGKMLGVLVCRDKEDRLGYLASFSGQVLTSNIHSGFVPPVFDILSEDSYFKKEEQKITDLNVKIRDLVSSDEFVAAKDEMDSFMDGCREVQAEMREVMRKSKERRDEIRRTRDVTEAEDALLRKESAEQKSMYKRTIKWQEQEFEKLKYHKLSAKVEELRCLRQQKSSELQTRIFRDFKFHNLKTGEEKDLLQIFDGIGAPPAATGECCGPRLLEYAYRNDYRPLALGEFWYGESPSAKVRHHGTFYHPCRGKCLPILSFMMKGTETEGDRNPYCTAEEEAISILYRDPSLVIICKPAGMNSVNGPDHDTSVERWARSTFPVAVGPMIVHRLDQDTSGIMVLAMNDYIHSQLQRQFASRTVNKKYIAVVNGIVESDSGTISLPLSPDINDRPCQMVDFENGKEAVTEYSVIERYESSTKLLLKPLTGRTHQLRVHCASKDGLHAPIIGDRLYSDKKSLSRLMLHATELSFVHPVSGQVMKFNCEPPF